MESRTGSPFDDDANVIGGGAAATVIGNGGDRHRALFLRRRPRRLRLGRVGERARRGGPVIDERIAVGVCRHRGDSRRLPDIDGARLARHGDGRCAVALRLLRWWRGLLSGSCLGGGHRRVRERCE